MKKANRILNVIMGAFAGVFLGHGIYVIWDFKTRPDLYAIQSAPWYTSILLYGAFTLAVFAVCIVLKVMLRHHAKKSACFERREAMKTSSTGYLILSITWMLVSLLWFLWIKNVPVGVLWLCAGIVAFVLACIRRKKERN